LSKIDLSGIDLRVFVVDDASSDGTADAVRREFPDVEVVEGDGSLHYAGGTNLGIEAARSFNPDFYLMMNDDAVFHEQFLRRMILTALDNERSVVGALLLLWDQPHKVFQVGQTWHALSGGWIIPEDLTAFNVGNEPFEVECLVGNCTLVPAAAVEQCGTMDAKRFPHGWGDAQYFMRLRKAGWRLLVDPKARVWCEPNTYPAPLHSLPKGKILNILFRDRRHPLNFQRQFIARWESAPNKLAALPAFAVYVLTLLGKGIGYGRRR
jgi:GT2 family glycosyltransferase